MEKIPKKRLFIAIALEQKAHEAIENILSPLKKQDTNSDLKWMPIENIHLTLRFLGDVPETDIKRLIVALTKTIQPLPSFTLTLNRLMHFPPEKQRILGLSVILTDALARLYQQIEKTVTEFGFEPEPRPFLPHLTLARARKKPIPALPDDIHIEQEQKVKKVTLFESKLNKQGSEYHVLRTFSLGEM